jgi:hypothetical protein
LIVSDFFRKLVVRRTLTRTLAAAVGTFASVYVIDAVLARVGLRADATLLDDFLLAIVVAVLVLSIELQHYKELRRQQAKLAVIGEMNHHVRNALQVIIGVTVDVANPEVASKIRESARRIEWALREILPADELDPAQLPPASAAWAERMKQQRQSQSGSETGERS